MPTSKGSSTPPTTSAATELDLARALASGALPPWADEPLHALLAERLGAPSRVVRERLAAMRLVTDVDATLLGLLDETWLCRARPGLDAQRLASVEGILAWTAFAEPYVLVRTHARDAVERERRLRALHTLLGERPLAQLARPRAPPPQRRLAREDVEILLALRAQPWAPLADLARACGATPKATKERVGKLAAGIRTRLVLPNTRSLLVRVSPSSNAAARAALAAIDGIVVAYVPDAGEATLVDASVAGDAPLDRARDVPGVRSVDLLRPVTEGDALDALLRGSLKRS